MSSSQSFDEAERFGTSTKPLADWQRKVTLSAKVKMEDDRYFEVDHETGDHNLYLRIRENDTQRIIDGFTAAQAEQLANALLVVAQKMREEEAS